MRGCAGVTRFARSVELMRHHGILKHKIILDGFHFVEMDSVIMYLMTPPPDKPFRCTTCHHSFRRRQDLVRHMCSTTHPRR